MDPILVALVVLVSALVAGAIGWAWSRSATTNALRRSHEQDLAVQVARLTEEAKRSAQAAAATAAEQALSAERAKLAGDERRLAAEERRLAGEREAAARPAPCLQRAFRRQSLIDEHPVPKLQLQQNPQLFLVVAYFDKNYMLKIPTIQQEQVLLYQVQIYEIYS